ncbi:hypothetical protein A9Q86_09165 [Flavobacteriales bacterium 33_180_T64]|nr:hypothetical protein A9Q86_09165 [Flavobacteriales bacterium 33_180_T64]
MTNNKQHISIQIVILLLTFVLILPSVVKFSHVFSHHEHEVCFGENQTHLHEVDLDCEFFKFKIQTQNTFLKPNYELLSTNNNHKTTPSYYTFLSDYQRLHFSLRGPPFNS